MRIRTRLTLWYSAILLGILVVIGSLSYSVLRWSLMQDLDASLMTVAQVVHDTRSDDADDSDLETILRNLLGPESYERFVQLFDPDGRPRPRVPQPRASTLPFSAQARANARRGIKTFETITHDREQVRILTMPIVEDNRVVRIVQVGSPLTRAQGVLRRYLETLVVLIPLGVGLAAAGGYVIAGKALRPVDEMTAAARRITAEDLHQRIRRQGTQDELDRLAETLNGMLARLDEAFRQMRRFAADAAHELRTPLTALKGGIEVALRQARTPEEYQHVLVSSLEDVDRLIRVAEDLLLLSRAAVPPEMPRPRIELEPLVLEALELGTRLAQGTGVHVKLGPVAPAAVRGDVSALGRAMRNLVENAVKYTPAGGTVDLTLRTADGQAFFAVRDTGIGIAPADAERIFEPFVRLDAARARETGGTGLGLAIARSIVLAHGGTLTLEREPGPGNCFVISLPLAS
jgi:two-component system, OmpR family, sensor kinase